MDILHDESRYGLRDLEERGYAGGKVHAIFVDAYGGEMDEPPDQGEMTDTQYSYYLSGWEQGVYDFVHGTIDDDMEDE